MKRFWDKVDKSGECWEWTGSRNRGRYGRITTGSRADGSMTSSPTHRLSWEMANGPIPEGMHVLHACDVPHCVNPAHLFLGTQADNNRDMVLKGRHHTTLTPDKVMEIRDYLRQGCMNKDIAAFMGLNNSTISRIKTGKIWSHI